MRSGLLQTITNLLFTKTEKTVNKDNNFKHTCKLIDFYMTLNFLLIVS